VIRRKDVSRALRIAFLSVLLSGVGLTAWRVGLSMRRGRRAVFSVEKKGAPLPQTLALDFLSFPIPGSLEGVGALPERGSLVSRRALALPPGTDVPFPFLVPPNAVLSFYAGASAAVGSMWVEILPVSGSGAKKLYERAVVDENKKKRFSGLPWEKVDVDLSPWSGSRVTLRFGVTSGPEISTVSARAFWGFPSVWTPDVRPWPERGAEPGRRVSGWDRRPPENVLWVAFQSFPVPSLNGLDLRDFPSLDRLAGEGVEFQRAYTNSLFSAEGLRALFLSRSPAADPAPGAPPPSSMKEARSLPVLLKEAGFKSVLLGAPGDAQSWLDLGFDEVHAAPGVGRGPEDVLRRAARWLADNEGRSPYFLFIYVRDPLPTEDPSPRCWLKAIRLLPSLLIDIGRWRAWAQAVQGDGALGRLWEQAGGFAGATRTLTLATSFRGRSFRWETVVRSSDGRRVRRRVRPGWSLREAETRALWLMKHPALTPGARITEPAQILDVAPTVLSLLSRPAGSAAMVPPPEKNWEGRSFAAVGLWAGAPTQAARFLLHGPGGEALLLDGHYKYVRRSPPAPLGRGRFRTAFEAEELYDLWSDPGEEGNLVRRQRHLLARARRAMADHWPERTATVFRFEGFVDPPLQGSIHSPGGDLWNVSFSTAGLTRAGVNAFHFTVADPVVELRFENWPPPASFIASLRVKGRPVPPESFIVSKLGLPLVESAGEDWYDLNRFPWMEGLSSSLGSSPVPRVYLGRVPVRQALFPEEAP
jgi:hypothetical protein